MRRILSSFFAKFGDYPWNMADNLVLFTNTVGDLSTTWEVPDLHQAGEEDIFVVTRNSPLGPEALRQIAALAAGEPYRVVAVKQGPVHALVVREALLRTFPEETLGDVVTAQAANLSYLPPMCALRVQNLTVQPGRDAVAETETPAAFSVGTLLQGEVITISPQDTVAEAADKMNDHRIGCLPVVEGGKLVGLVTSRDLRQVPGKWYVSDVMTTELVIVSQNTSLWDAYCMMQKAGVERLLVGDGGAVQGVVTRNDLSRSLGGQRDSLTGLYTSAILRTVGESHLQKGEEITIIFIDLNNFGAVNKEHGHVFGDKVLCAVAMLLKESCQDGIDLPCRFGGDEFAILTTKRGLEAYNLAQQIIEAINNLEHPEGISVSACAGVAGGRRKTFRAGLHIASTIDNLINLASKASTAAKKQNVAVVTAGEIAAAG